MDNQMDQQMKQAEKKMSAKIVLKKTLVIVVALTIVGLLTLGSGMIVKLFIKANSCHKTKLLLFVSGIVLALLLAGLGYAYFKIDQDYTYGLSLFQWMHSEQFRYRTSPSMSGSIQTSSPLVS